jgi:hypothetical protein
VERGLLSRELCVGAVAAEKAWISPRVRALAASDQLSELALAPTVAPCFVSCVVIDDIGLFLGEQLVQGLPLRCLCGCRSESEGTSVPVAGVPGIVAVAVEQRVFGAVAFEWLAGIIASGHLPTSELAASPWPGETVDNRLPLILAEISTAERAERKDRGQVRRWSLAAVSSSRRVGTVTMNRVAEDLASPCESPKSVVTTSPEYRGRPRGEIWPDPLLDWEVLT